MEFSGLGPYTSLRESRCDNTQVRSLSAQCQGDIANDYIGIATMSQSYPNLSIRTSVNPVAQEAHDCRQL